MQLCADEGDRLWSLGSGFAQCWSVKTGEELQRINVPELGLLQRFSSGVGFGIGALFTIVRLPIPVPNVLPGILSIVFMYVGYLVVKYFMP